MEIDIKNFQGFRILRENQIHNGYGNKTSCDTHAPIGRDSPGVGYSKNENVAYIFGGYWNRAGPFDYSYNDLWKYEVLTNRFRYAAGSAEYNLQGSYGQKGQFLPGNIPTSRFDSRVFCYKNNVYILFGIHLWNTTLHTFNDVWIYNTSKEEYAWIAGTNLVEDEGHIETIRSFNQKNIPRARFAFAAAQLERTIWIFGGQCVDEILPQVLPSSVWVLDLTKLEFMIITDSEGLGEQTKINKPGGRKGSYIQKLSDKSFLIFGGRGGNALGQYGNLNDYFLFEHDLINDHLCYNIHCNDLNVCNGGKCISEDLCECKKEYYGDECVEFIASTGYFDEFKTSITIVYEISYDILHSKGLNEKEVFYCDERIKNFENTDVECKWGRDETNQKTTHLNIDLDLLLNQTDLSVLYVKTVTNESHIVAIEINEFEDKNLPLIFTIISIISSIVVILIIVLFMILVVCILKQKKKIKKYREVGGDIIIEERELQNKEIPRFKINQKLFEINYNEVKLLSSIARGGGNAEVFLAKWNDKLVAFKVFQVSLFATQGSYNGFEKEIQMASSLHLQNPRIGIVMEYCKGGDLSTLLEEIKLGEVKPLRFQQKLSILSSICSAMKFIHSKNIIHRDIKSGNILLDANYTIGKLIDFGLSRTIDQSSVFTRKCGTSFYMAPELYNNSKYGKEVDVFSMAIVMYEVLMETNDPYEGRKGKSDGLSIEVHVSRNKNFRPVIPRNDKRLKGKEWYINAMVRCWSESINERLTFQRLYQIFQRQIRK